MDIYYLGHSSFHLKGLTSSVVTDPFSPDSVGIRFPKVSAAIVTISHGHDDHNKSDLVTDVKKVIDGPGEYEINGISILGFETFHDDKKGKERGKNTVYVYEIDGLRLAHLGDLGHKLSEATVNGMGDIDILMVPVGGVYTIGPAEAAEVVRSIEPKITIPMHYQVPGLNPATFSELKDEKPFISELGYPSKQEKKLSVKAGTLSEEQEVVVLSLS